MPIVRDNGWRDTAVLPLQSSRDIKKYSTSTVAVLALLVVGSLTLVCSLAGRRARKATQQRDVVSNELAAALSPILQRAYEWFNPR
jgi:hypothetical protein